MQKAVDFPTLAEYNQTIIGLSVSVKGEGKMERLNNERPGSTTIQELCEEYKRNNVITKEEYERHHVKRGLRNSDGTGVMAGLTHVCNVHGYLIADGDKIPDKGELTYRGINVEDIVRGFEAEDRFGFEEVVWLLIFGQLPTRGQ